MEFLNIPLDTIKNMVQEYLQIENIGIRSRKTEIVFAKKLYSYAARKYSGESHGKIMQFLGAYNHTSNITNIQVLQGWMETEAETKEKVEVFINLLLPLTIPPTKQVVYFEPKGGWNE